MDNSDILNYRVIGNGYPVVFLHGFLESIEMWNYFSFENNFKCVLVDLPGHGDSSHFSKASTSMNLMANEVRKVIDKLSLSDYSVVGHSMGGYVGLELKKLDRRCRELVLLNSNFWQDSELKKEERKRVAEIVKRNKNLFLYEAIPNLFNDPVTYDNAIKTIIAEAKSMEATTIGMISLAMAERIDFERELVDFSHKILIVQGEFDTIVPKEKMDEALLALPEIHVEYIKSGHMAHIEETEKTEKIIRDFLKQKTETC